MELTSKLRCCFLQKRAKRMWQSPAEIAPFSLGGGDGLALADLLALYVLILCQLMDTNRLKGD